MAIFAAVTEPGPVGVEAGPERSVRTPIFTTSSETCANERPPLALSRTAASISFARCLFICPPWFWFGLREGYALRSPLAMPSQLAPTIAVRQENAEIREIGLAHREPDRRHVELFGSG